MDAHVSERAVEVLRALAEAGDGWHKPLSPQAAADLWRVGLVERHVVLELIRPGARPARRLRYRAGPAGVSYLRARAARDDRGRAGETIAGG